MLDESLLAFFSLQAKSFEANPAQPFATFGLLLSAPMVGSLKMNTTLEYSTRVVQEGDRRCKKSTLNDLAYLTPLRIPLMNPVLLYTDK